MQSLSSSTTRFVLGFSAILIVVLSQGNCPAGYTSANPGPVINGGCPSGYCLSSDGSTCYVSPATTAPPPPTSAPPVTTPPTVAAGSGNCADTSTKCATWISNGFCSEYSEAIINEYCAKSCYNSACHGGPPTTPAINGVPTVCADANPACPSWVANGFCSQSMYASIRTTCAKSCSLCTSGR